MEWRCRASALRRRRGCIRQIRPSIRRDIIRKFRIGHQQSLHTSTHYDVMALRLTGRRHCIAEYCRTMRLLNSYLCPSIQTIASPGCIIVDRDIWFYSCVDLEPLRPNRAYRKLENRNHLRSMERLLIVRSSNTEWSAD